MLPIAMIHCPRCRRHLLKAVLHLQVLDMKSKQAPPLPRTHLSVYRVRGHEAFHMLRPTEGKLLFFISAVAGVAFLLVGTGGRGDAADGGCCEFPIWRWGPVIRLISSFFSMPLAFLLGFAWRHVGRCDRARVKQCVKVPRFGEVNCTKSGCDSLPGKDLSATSQLHRAARTHPQIV